MNIHIKTVAKHCHITVKIREDNNVLLSLTENDEGSAQLLPNTTYIFEWHVFTGSQPAKANIQALVVPANDGFPPLKIDKEYAPGERDGAPFIFTLTEIK
ncbi:MAG TPA: hypothetical protein VKX33_00565 [Cyclobacteriaceae bacterium]|nr:hypothetical protein [Cyclobacteriaceae bacterium]